MYVLTIVCAALAVASANPTCTCPADDPDVIKRLDDHDAKINKLIARTQAVKDTINRRKEERADADKDSKNMLLRLNKLDISAEEDKCPKKHFKCVTGGDSFGKRCVANLLVCDGTNDCLDGSDEDPNLCSDAHNTWGYQGKHGPSHWKDNDPGCVGARQSPIDIRENHVTYEDLGQIIFRNYDNERLGMRLKNNGHAAQVDITRRKAYIKGSNLADKKYQLAQFHFHWGSDSTKGSEHTYEGNAYAAELHFVHFNTQYQNLSQAADKEPSGLAVLGVFIEVGMTDNPAFTNIINALVNITHPGSQQDIESVRLDALLPCNTADYYRYQGSLTTPPCYESVQWTVFKTPVQLSETQLSEFRKLLSSGTSPLVNNYRPTQFVKFRPVYSDVSRP